jgi:hypothetical protein
MKTYSRQHAALSAETIRTAMADLKKIRHRMTLTSLTLEERFEYQQDRAQRLSLRVLEDRVLAARQYRELLPVSFDLRRFERDTQLARALHDCLSFVEETRQALRDTLLMVKACSAQAGLVVHGHLKIADGPDRNLKWAVNKLSHHHKLARQSAPKEVPPPATVVSLPPPAEAAVATRGTPAFPLRACAGSASD